jgi:anti-sigma regulatory factor (Ser/Thr protein kinase)
LSSRTKVITGLTLLVALWMAAAGPALADAIRLMSARISATDLGGPAGTLVLSLETERRQSVIDGSPAELAAQRVHTDHARQELSAARAGWTHDLAGSDAVRQADALLARTGKLAEVRAQLDARGLTPVRAADAYTALIDPVGLQTPTVYPDQLGDRTPGLSALSRARELLAEQDALLAATAGRAKRTDADRARLSSLAGARRTLIAGVGGGLPASVDADLAIAETALLAGKDDGAAWSTAYNRANTELWALQNSGTQAAADATAGHAVAAVVRAGLIGVVGLIAVIAVLLTALRSRGRPTGATRSSAQPAAGPGRAAALDPLLRDLERRNQSLLHRQLRLLDTLARRESDDDTLGDLFRADHLATRMRRNLEKSITLAGGAPGRRWSRPMPMAEVVRAAAAEISEYGRVSTARIDPVALAGPAITDVMHLLAELIENAATFAPAETRVRVVGERHGIGYRITVTDVGPGMTGDDLATAARVLADPEPPAGGTWWGLYAAGRFAARSGVVIALHNGPDGGLVADVDLPVALISPAGSDDDTTLHDLEPVIN